jgi:hypothetical protein
MDRKIVLSVLAAALLGFIGIMLLMPERADDAFARLPWKVTHDSQGRTQVFGFTLGATTLADVRRVFGEDGKVNLFARPNSPDSLAAEAYFDHVYLNSLRADFVLTLDVPTNRLQDMYERGLRISQLGSGAKKITLGPDDAAKLAAAPVRSITYLPWKHLDAAVIARRFGEPAERITEESGVVHWLYPAEGMDIARDPGGGVVIQYVNAKDFTKLAAPLQAAGDNGSAAQAKGPSSPAVPSKP